MALMRHYAATTVDAMPEVYFGMGPDKVVDLARRCHEGKKALLSRFVDTEVATGSVPAVLSAINTSAAAATLVDTVTAAFAALDEALRQKAELEAEVVKLDAKLHHVRLAACACHCHWRDACACAAAAAAAAAIAANAAGAVPGDEEEAVGGAGGL